MTAPAIAARGVRKTFGPVVAVGGVDLEAAPGEILAIVGENGAGKTTLMNCLYGLYRPDGGEIVVRGAPANFRGPRDAIAAGIGMVHQHFRLVKNLTVAENVTLGHEPRAGLAFDRAEAARAVVALAKDLGFTIDPRDRVDALSVGAQQRVEILKALSRGASVLILDEPTAVLTPQECDDLFAVLRRLAEGGKTLLFISHKLGEVMAISSRVMVMRAGKVEATRETRTTTARELATLMVGREPSPAPVRAAREPGAVVLSVRELEAADDRGLPAVRGVSLEVRAGEVLGIAGVEGNGQSELVEVIAGLRAVESGEVRISHGGTHPLPGNSGEIGHIPGDRHHRGVIEEFSLEENLLLGRHREAAFRRRFGRNAKAIRAFARKTLADFDVRPPDPDLPVKALSGGNQQKLVVARELGRAPALLVAAHPTRGVDIGAIEQIHARILAERERGAAVLLVSSDLSEILALSDRVAVLYSGRIAHLTAARDTDERTLGPYMTGAAS